MKRILIIIPLLFLVGCSNTKENTTGSLQSEYTDTETSVLSGDKITNEMKIDLKDILLKSKEKGMKLRALLEEKEQVSTVAYGVVNIKKLADIEKTTEIGIEGFVKDTEPFIYQADSGEKSPYTKVTVFVTNVLNGPENLLNTEIDVYEAGGLITKGDLGMSKNAEKVSESERKQEVVVNFDGVKNSMPGDEVVFFLVKLPGKSLGIANTFYQIMGNHKTRFDKNEKTDEYERVETMDNDNMEDTITTKELAILNEKINDIVEEE